MTTFEGKNYIGGQWRPAASNRTFEQRNPAKLADVTGTFAESGAEDADAAIAAAKAAFPEWRALSPQARKRLLEQSLGAMRARRDEIAAVITQGNGKPMVGDSRIRAISFTGSTAVGKAIQLEAARNLTPTQLELGGKNPAIVLADADLDYAVAEIVRAAYTVAGQWCTSTSRVIVVEE